MFKFRSFAYVDVYNFIFIIIVHFPVKKNYNKITISLLRKVPRNKENLYRIYEKKFVKTS